MAALTEKQKKGIANRCQREKKKGFASGFKTGYARAMASIRARRKNKKGGSS